MQSPHRLHLVQSFQELFLPRVTLETTNKCFTAQKNYQVFTDIKTWVFFPNTYPLAFNPS